MSSRRKQASPEDPFPLASQGSEFDDGGITELMAKMQGEFTKKKKKKETQHLQDAQLVMKDVATREGDIRAAAMKAMSEAYEAFLLEDAEDSDTIRKLWSMAVETHGTLQNAAEKLAVASDASLQQSDAKQMDAKQAYEVALHTEEKLLATVKAD